jgi:hypothetical protein
MSGIAHPIVYVTVDAIVDVDVPPPDSFDAAHSDAWRKDRLVYTGFLKNPIPIDRFKADFELVPDEEDAPVGQSITGQVFVRHTNMVVSGRKVVFLVAVIGVEDEDSFLDGEAKYTVVGTEDGLVLRVLPESKDERIDFRGWRIDQVLTAEHWQI